MYCFNNWCILAIALSLKFCVYYFDLKISFLSLTLKKSNAWLKNSHCIKNFSVVNKIRNFANQLKTPYFSLKIAVAETRLYQKSIPKNSSNAYNLEKSLSEKYRLKPHFGYTQATTNSPTLSHINNDQSKSVRICVLSVHQFSLALSLTYFRYCLFIFLTSSNISELCKL